MSGFPIPPQGGQSLFGNAFMGDFVMDGVTAPPASGGPAMSGPTAVSGTPQYVGVTQSYESNADSYFHNLTINAGVVFALAGDRLYVAGTLTLQAGSYIDGQLLGILNASTNGGAGGGALTTDPVGLMGAGGAGGNPNAGSNGVAYTTATMGINPDLVAQIGGAGGAGGASATPNAGGTGGAAIAVTEQQGLPFGLLSAYGLQVASGGVIMYGGGMGGGGGGGDGTAGSTHRGGGGGGGNCPTIIFANRIVGSGTIWSAGGAGALPGVLNTNGGGGGGGGGGGVIIVSNSVTWNGSAMALPSGLIVASPGGAGGAARGTGTAGTAGGNGQIILIPA